MVILTLSWNREKQKMRRIRICIRQWNGSTSNQKMSETPSPSRVFKYFFAESLKYPAWWDGCQLAW